MLIGTAGHVKHGKTSLIRALTGVDTDRLPEEKRRGLSVDLGFAYLDRPDGRVFGFVDVPGHDRYLHNMIAGVLPLHVAILVVSGLEGPGPQTREHAEIFDLIGVHHVVAVLTKIDCGDAHALDRSEAQLREVLRHTAFANAQVIRLSAATGQGLNSLLAHLDDVAADAGDASAGFRLTVDRAFTLQGVGTVVTGTVISGSVAVGDRLIVSPSGLVARVRSLHAQNRPVSLASCGVRCAVAMSGPEIETGKIRRGDVLVAPALHMPAELIGVRLKRAGAGTLKNGRTFMLHYGTGRIAARLRVVADGDTGTASYAELTPAEPIAVLAGDRVLLRDERRSVAGGIVVEPFLPPGGRARTERSKLLEAAALEDHTDAVRARLDRAGFVDLDQFRIARNLSATQMQKLAAHFADPAAGKPGRQVLLSERMRSETTSHLIARIAAHHEKHPHVLGPRKAEVLSMLGRMFSRTAVLACLEHAFAEGSVVSDGACIRLPSHRPHLREEDERLWATLHPLMKDVPLRPPHLGALAEACGLAVKDMDSRLMRFAKIGRLTRVARNRFLLPEAIEAFAATAAGLVRDSGGEGFTAADFNRHTGIGRNFTIEILEHLDLVGITRRVGTRRHTR